MGSFWTSPGVYVATFRAKNLNYGKPRILLEKRSSGAHGGSQGVVILSVLGQKICPKSTQGLPKRAKRHTKTRRRGSKGHRRGAERTTRPPKSEKSEIWVVPPGGGGTEGTEGTLRKPRGPPPPLSAEPRRRTPPRVSVETQSQRLYRDSTDTLRLREDS